MPSSSPLVAGLSFFFLESNLKTKQKHGASAVLCLSLLLSGCVGGNGSKAITATPPASTTVTVSIASPSNGAALTSSSVHVVATAAASQAIRTLVITLDGTQVATANGSGIDTMITAGNGAHTLVARATDAMGNAGQAMVEFTVALPQSQISLSITAPAENSIRLSPVQVTATASGNNAITSMQAFLDGKQVAATNSGSFNSSVTAGLGAHTLIVQATDSQGTTAQQTADFTVSAPAVAAVALEGTTDPSDGYFPFNGFSGSFALDATTGNISSSTPASTVIGGGSFSQPFGVLADAMGTRMLVLNSNDRNGPGMMQVLTMNQATAQMQQSDLWFIGDTSVNAFVQGPGEQFIYSGGVDCGRNASCAQNLAQGILAWQISGGQLNMVSGSPFGMQDLPFGAAGLAYDAQHQFVLAEDTDNGATSIVTYTADPASGALTFKNRTPLNGTGVLGPVMGKFAFVLFGGKAQAFAIAADGSLKAAASSTVQSGRMFADRNGRFAFVAPADGTTTAVWVYRVNQNTGALTQVVRQSLGASPMWVAQDASGQLVYVADGSNISVFRLDEKTGLLKEVQGSPVTVGTTENPTASAVGISSIVQ